MLAALQGHFGELGICLRARKVGLGLHDLLIEIGRIDFGKQIAGFYLRADIGLPFFQIAADARVKWRLLVGFQPAGQIKCRHAALCRARDGDDGNRLRLGPFAHFCVGRFARNDARDDQ